MKNSATIEPLNSSRTLLLTLIWALRNESPCW